MSNCRNYASLLLSLFISIVLSFFIFDFLLFTNIISSNLVAYALLLSVWCIAFGLSYYLISKSTIKIPLNRAFSSFKAITCSIILAIIPILLFTLAIFRSNVLGRSAELVDTYVIPNFSFIKLLILFILVIIGFYIESAIMIKQKYKNLIYILVAIIICIITSILVFQPNAKEVIKNLDFDAYWHSAYLIHNNYSITFTTASFYGHYGIILKPIFDLFGFNLNTIFGILVVERLIIISSLSYLIYNSTKSFMMRLLGLGMLFEFSLLATGIYPQAWDHRVLFPAVFMLLAYFVTSNIVNNKKYIHVLTLGFIISVFSLIWSNDIGIIILIAWCALTFIVASYKNKRYFINLLVIITLGIITFCLSWGITNLFNMFILNGDIINLRLYLYPVLESNGISAFASRIGLKLQPYILVIIFMLSWLGLSLTKLFKDNKSEYLFPMFISILSCGCMIYFINRPAWGNLRVSCQLEAIILMILTGEVLLRKYKHYQNNFTHKSLITGALISQILIYTAISYVAFICIKPITNNWIKANSDTSYYSSESFTKSFNDNSILIGNSALYIVTNEKLESSALIVPNFINLFDSQPTVNELVENRKILWVDDENIDLFYKFMGKNITEHYESPSLWESGNIKYYIFEPKN